MRFAFFAPLPRIAVCGHSSSADSESEHLIQPEIKQTRITPSESQVSLAE
jgi:hypothetical protein